MHTTTEQRLRWCVPQSLLDVANSVDWPHCMYPPGLLADGLRMLARSKKRSLPLVKKAVPVPPDPPVLRLAPDVPQEILDVLNEINWTEVDEQDQYAMAAELEGFVFSPFVNLPRRHWQ